MINEIVLIAYGILLIVGGIFGFKKGSKISLIMGLLSGILIFVGVWLLTFMPKSAWIFLICVNLLLMGSFFSRLIKTKKFMPSGMLLLLALGVFIFCLINLNAHA